MKKKVLAGIMMAVMMMASVMSVSAAGSVSKEVYPSGTNVADHKTDLIFDGVEDSVIATIKELNAEKVTSLSADVQKKLAGKTLVAEVVDLEHVGAADTCKNGHKVQLTVTPLTDNCKNVVVLHYSTVDKAWEVIEDVTVDYANKTVTAVYDDLSPVAIYATVSQGGSTGNSPQTVGTSSAWMLWTAVAIVALGAGIVATQKKSRS